MKRANDIETATFYTGIEDFMLDVVIHNSGEVQFDTWFYRESVGIKEYVTGYMREYCYTVDEAADDTGSYLLTECGDGNTWYQDYDLEYN